MYPDFESRHRAHIEAMTSEQKTEVYLAVIKERHAGFDMHAKEVYELSRKVAELEAENLHLRAVLSVYDNAAMKEAA